MAFAGSTVRNNAAGLRLKPSVPGRLPSSTPVASSGKENVRLKRFDTCDLPATRTALENTHWFEMGFRAQKWFQWVSRLSSALNGTMAY